MARMARWFRFYDDFFTHSKTKRLKNPLYKLVVIAAWAISNKSPVRGVLLIGKGLPAEPQDIANELDISVEIVEEALGTPESPGPVTKNALYLTWNEKGVLYSPAWIERQFENDPTNKERQARFRENQRAENPEPDG